MDGLCVQLVVLFPESFSELGTSESRSTITSKNRGSWLLLAAVVIIMGSSISFGIVESKCNWLEFESRVGGWGKKCTGARQIGQVE